MKRMRVATVSVALVMLAVVSAAPKLSDLRGVDDLKALFNNDAGKVRLVLLVSPT